MADKKETTAPKVELKEGNITITGKKLSMGVKDNSNKKFDVESNIVIDDPVVSIPYNKEVLDDLASILLLLADVTNAKQGGLAGPETIKKVLKDYKKAYKDFKKEGAEE